MVVWDDIKARIAKQIDNVGYMETTVSLLEAGIGLSMAQKLVNGKYNYCPKVKLLLKIGEALKVDTAELLRRINSEQVEKVKTNQINTDLSREAEEMKLPRSRAK